MGSLPVNWVGLVLLGVGLVLFFMELQAPGWGGFGLAGGVSFIVGGFLLFGDSSIPGLPAPDVRVGYGVLGGTTLLMGISLVGLWYFARKAKSLVTLPRESEVVGQTGIVRMALEPKGTVQVASELWTAESDSGETIEAGESVVIAEVDGITLKVFKVDNLEASGRSIL
jgi:membrane-bound serine protease (ClpP class)